MMGGNITLESTPNMGTCFHVGLSLYIADKEYQKSNEQGTRLLPMNLHSRILVVDDHPVNLFLMRNILNNFGFKNLIEAKSGKEALTFMDIQEFDLIFMDCQMPDMDGFETTRRIREQYLQKKIIIVALTADAMKGVAEKCLASGMDDYLSKPLEAGRLHEILQRLLPTNDEKPAVIIQEKLKHDHHIIFNQSQLDEFTSGDPTKELEVITLFSNITKESLSALEHSIATHDSAEWKAHTHRLYGSSMTFGAVAFAEICEEAQELYEANTDEKRSIKINSRYEELNEYLKDDHLRA